MKRLLLVLLLTIPSTVYAQPVEESNELWEATKQIVETLDPAIDNLYVFKNADLDDGEWITGISASVYRFTYDDQHIASARLGYVPTPDHRIYAGAEADLKGVTMKLLPDYIKHALSPGQTYKFWDIIDKYGTFGIIGGYDFENENFIWGPSLAAKIKF